MAMLCILSAQTTITWLGDTTFPTLPVLINYWSWPIIGITTYSGLAAFAINAPNEKANIAATLILFLIFGGVSTFIWQGVIPFELFEKPEPFNIRFVHAVTILVPPAIFSCFMICMIYSHHTGGRPQK